MTPLLEVLKLSKAFGGVKAVTQVSFSVAAGELLAMIGPNGAGKSTCFNMLNGQLRPDEGSIRLAGRELVGLAPREVWRMGVGRTFQITATFGSMTVRENVQMALLSHHRALVSAWMPAPGCPQQRLSLPRPMHCLNGWACANRPRDPARFSLTAISSASNLRLRSPTPQSCFSWMSPPQEWGRSSEPT